MASIDDIINGTFKSLGSSATSGWTTPKPTYQPGMMGRGQTYGSDRLAPSWQPSLAAIEAMAPRYAAQPTTMSAYAPSPSSVSLPRPRPGYAPTSIDMAAINAPGVATASGAMKPSAGGLLGLITGNLGGGLMEQLTGPSKNGLGGLAGLLGGPEQGGLLQMLMGNRTAPMQPAVRAPTPSETYDNTNAMARARAQATATRAPRTSSSRNNDGSWATGETSGSPFW